MGEQEKNSMDINKSNKGQTSNKQVIPEKATFEEAIVATGFGKFNILLLCFLFPSSFTQASEQMSLSYVLPMAECDLNLTLEQKGLISSITFAGMVSSGLIFGIICDTFGRKKLIVYGYILHCLCCLVAATSTNVTQLMIAKFFCGFIFNGPFSATTTYLSEFHSFNYRSRVQLIRGITYCTGFFLLPILAWVVLPTGYEFNLFGFGKMHAWNLFLMFCACCPLVAAGLFACLPESPKFLMSAGKNDEALKVFQTVYSLNSGKKREDFPVKELIQENKDESDTKKKSVREFISTGWSRIAVNFMPPHLYRLILACTTALTVLMGLHTIKLWLPQILQMITDYEQKHNGTSTNVCVYINSMKENDKLQDETCQVNTDNSYVYINSMIINGSEVIFFCISGFFVNCLGKIKLMTILASAGAVFVICCYFAPSSAILITLFTLYISAVDMTGVMAMTITLEMFPTHFRALAISFHLTSARVGSLLANILFPHLVTAGCIAPFLFCSLLTGALPFLFYMYPNTENKALQ